QFNTNLSQVCFFSCKHCVALISLMVNPEPIVYIVSFAVVTCIEFIFNFLWITRNNIDLKGLIDNNILIQLIDLVKENYIFSFGVIVGVFVSQLDKILLSHYVETQLYGVYVIVAQLGLSFLQLQYPLMKSLLPALSS
ncbi:O90/O127 family O-antigen flippase, partial [Escherichia coli]|nr:O90/O127 family O-antigen flippase [Escherichia coli]